jgi:hypothetical protein
VDYCFESEFGHLTETLLLRVQRTKLDVVLVEK